MRITRAWSMPNKWTFTIKPIAELLARYVGNGKGWIDPFAGMYSPAEFTNDLNPEMPTQYHLEAVEFCEQLSGKYNGILFDPPYSYRQITEHYQSLNLKASQQDTQSYFYSRVMNKSCDKIKTGGYAITCGWHSNGFGLRRGFDIIEILLVAHGSHHNDTIVTVERKIQHQFQFGSSTTLKVLDKETIERLSIAWEEEIIYSLEHPFGNAPAKWEDRLLNAQVDYNNRQLKEEK